MEWLERFELEDRREVDERFDRDELFRVPERLEELFERDDPLRDLRELDFFGGTFAPFFLASERPIATACFRLVTFFPLPLFNVPRLRRRIVLSTDFCAFFPYLAISAPFAAVGGGPRRGRYGCETCSRAESATFAAPPQLFWTSHQTRGPARGSPTGPFSPRDRGGVASRRKKRR